MRKYKITKETLRNIQSMAKHLPAVSEQSKSWVSGRRLLETQDNEQSKELIKLITEQRGAIDPTKQYQILTPVAVNHERRLKKAFEAEGRKGVLKYLIPFANDEYKAQFEAELKTLK